MSNDPDPRFGQLQRPGLNARQWEWGDAYDIDIGVDDGLMVGTAQRRPRRPDHRR